MYKLETKRRGSRVGRFIAGAFAAAAVIVAVAALSWPRRAPAPSAEAPPPTSSVAAPELAKPSAPLPAARPVRVRPLLESLSPNALLRRGLAEGDPLRRWAIATDNLAEGVSPREQLGFFVLRQPFSVTLRGDKSVIAQASYARYDAFADLIASLDAKALAAAYGEVHALLESAYRALGYPGASLDAVTARALHRIESAPVRDTEVVVEPEGGFFEFAEPTLRELGEVEKHLLRMGPRNTRILQAKARELQEALSLAGGAQVAAHP